MPFIIDDLLLGLPFLMSAYRAYAMASGDGGALALGVPDVAACRAAVPTEPGLQHTGALLGGYMYSGNDPAHVAYLHQYLDVHADQASGEDKRRILAFKALQGREGSTAAINTYDNQLFTWGTGWGGLGGLGRVMGHLNENPRAVAALHACGVDYMGGNQWCVIDGSGQTVCGKDSALNVIKSTPALLNLFIHLAKAAETRDVVTDAQLRAFMETSGQVPGSEEIATQALFNLVTHLKHWAPGFVDFPSKYPLSIVQEAAAKVPGAPSADRDRALAREIVRGFYARTGKWVPDWKQAQGYILRDMKADGLDVSGDAELAAAVHPAVAAKTAAGCGSNWASFKTAGGCGNYFRLDDDVCGNWGPWDAQFRSSEMSSPVPIKVAGGRGGGGHAGYNGHFHHRWHPWYRGGFAWTGVPYDALFVESPECWAVQVGPEGELACLGAMPVDVGALSPGTVYDATWQPIGVARAIQEGYDLVPPGFEGAREVHDEPDAAKVAGGSGDPRFGGVSHIDPRMVHDAPGISHFAGGPGIGWGEVLDEHTGKRVAGPGGVTPDQLFTIKRGIVDAVLAGDTDPINWTQIKVGNYDLMVTNEPISVHGLRLPTSFDDAVIVSSAIGALPITPVISDARWVNAKRVYAQPLNDATGALLNDPSQVVRYNERMGANTGEFRDGFWKEVNVHPSLKPEGRGSMAQYGFRDTATHMFERGGPSNHDKTYKDYSDTPTYVSRKALKDGQLVDLLDEYAAGGLLTAALPTWLITRLRGREAVA